MLGWMRKQTRSWFVYIAFGIIIVVFVFFYGWGGKRGARGQTIAAEVNGQEITRYQYDESYQNLWTLSKNLYKRELSGEEAKQLRQRALDDLVERTLILQEAKRWGLSATLDEVKEQIAHTPAFQMGGKFSKERYLQQLAANRMMPSEFERTMRANMQLSKLIDVLQTTAKLSEKELFELYRLESEKVNLRFFKLDALDFEKRIEVLPEAIQEHHESTKESYRVPAKVKVKYLSFDLPRFREEVKIAPEEIAEFYKANQGRFMHRKRVKARQILMEVKKEGGSKGEEEARQKAEEVRKRIEKGEDFVQLAKKLSQDNATAAKGGDLGYVESGQVGEGFDEVAFSLKPGEVSPVVKTPRGFSIIKVEEVQEEGVEPLEKVRGTIEEELREERAYELTKEEAQRAMSKIYRGDDVVSYAEKKGLEVYETDFFSEGEFITGIGKNKDFNEAAFLLKPGGASPLIGAEKKFYILQLVEKRESYLPGLEEVKEKVIKSLKKERSQGAAKEKAEQLLEELISGTPMDQMAARENLTAEETGLFNRQSGFINKIGFSEDLARDAFYLTYKSPTPQKVYGMGNRYFIVQLKERREGEEEAFQSQKDALRERFLTQKREGRLTSWLKGLKDKAKIKTFLTV